MPVLPGQLRRPQAPPVGTSVGNDHRSAGPDFQGGSGSAGRGSQGELTPVRQPGDQGWAPSFVKITRRSGAVPQPPVRPARGWRHLARLGLARELDAANDGLFFRGDPRPAIPIDGLSGRPEHPLARRHDPGCTADIKLVSLALPLQRPRIRGSFGRDRFPADQRVGLNRASRGLDLKRRLRGEPGKLEQGFR